jgi:hypothetical protein
MTKLKLQLRRRCWRNWQCKMVSTVRMDMGIALARDQCGPP